VSSLPPKVPRIKLDRDAYQNLRQQVLERDSWRCQLCGAMAGVEVHHIHRRSQGGEDTKNNLITLCSGCHRAAHS